MAGIAAAITIGTPPVRRQAVRFAAARFLSKLASGTVTGQ